jgi:transcriptional regulator with AAA-type ATPase domain
MQRLERYLWPGNIQELRTVLERAILVARSDVLEISEMPIPRALEDILMACLEKSPAQRVASALELDARLARVPVARPWSPDDARAWWEMHASDVLRGEAR